MTENQKAAVFILLGQSNAVGHGIPMKEEDKIKEPLKNVFGLERQRNQTFDNSELYWSGYTSGGMNLAEEQDHTYSIANCLAKLWQDAISSDKEADLPDLYIVHIAIGAQGVTDGYMWNPGYDQKLIPGKLGEVDISLYPFTMHVLSLVKDSIRKLGKTPEIIGLHWRGGEEEGIVETERLRNTLKATYDIIFGGFIEALGEKCPIILHKIVCHDRALDLDPSGESLKRLHYINEVFAHLCEENDNIKIFDVCQCPLYISNVRGNGLFIEDAVHFTPEVNEWVAKKILEEYILK